MFNTTIETLRHYEEKGLLRPEILDNNYRQYDFHDLQKLRQILMFRELGLSVDEISKLDKQIIKEKEYIMLMKKHQRDLEIRIQRLNETNENVKHLLELLEKDTAYSFRLKDVNRRVYYALEPVHSELMAVPKKYFERFKALIESEFYTESTLQMVYPYEALKTSEIIPSRFCVELPSEGFDTIEKSEDVKLLTLNEGTYLSMFYPFSHGEFEDFEEHFKNIENYLKKNNLQRQGELVLEKEHPELSLYLGENVTMYELQIQVRKNSK